MLKKLAVAVLVLLLLAVAGIVVAYQMLGRALPEAQQHLQGSGYEASLADDGSLFFRPSVANGHGLLIMPAALAEPLAYAQTAGFFASNGYTVFVPRGTLRLPGNTVAVAALRMSELDMDDWFVIGHSAGGSAALQLILRQDLAVKALALWATDVVGDYSQLNVPMLYIRGDRDGLLPEERFDAVQARLPESVRYLSVQGGNHRGFALYSRQLFDNSATTSAERQIAFANDRTARFFAARF